MGGCGTAHLDVEGRKALLHVVVSRMCRARALAGWRWDGP
jgi:hypothetical protein